MGGLRSRVGRVCVFVGSLVLPVAGQECGIRVTITDASGAVIPGAAVSVVRSGERTAMLAVTADGSGAAKARLAAGAYHLAVSSPGFRMAERDIVLAGWTEERLALDVAGSCGPCVQVGDPPIALIPSDLTSRLPESRLGRLMHRK